SSPVYGEKVEDQLAEAKREMALLRLIADTGQGTVNQALIYIRSLDEARQTQRTRLKELYEKLFSNQWGLEVSGINGIDLIVLKGAHAVSVARVEEGTHLFFPAHENFIPIQVIVLPLSNGVDPVSVLKDEVENRRRWLDRFS